MILPPRLVVVLNHASTVKVCAAEIHPVVVPGTVADPLKVLAVWRRRDGSERCGHARQVRSLPLALSQPVDPSPSSRQ